MVPSFCRLCIFDFFIAFVVIGVDDIDEAYKAIDTNEAIDVVTVVLMVFCGQDLEKWPICPPPPSWLDPRSPVYEVLLGNLLC